MKNLLHDIRCGLRILAKHKGFTLVAVITLALGIGANTAIFSVVDAVLLRPLPFKDPDRLVFIWGRHAAQGDELQQVSYLDFADIRAQSEVFEDVAAIFVQRWTLTAAGEAARVNGLQVSPSLFRVLGAQPALGRLFLPEEEQAGKDRVALLSGHNTGSALTVQERPLPLGEQPPGVGWQVVMPGYFKTMGIPLLRGRDFTEEDFQRAQHSTIVNETLARTIFAGEDPIGKRVQFGTPQTKDWHEIIGVVGDVRHLDLETQPQPRAYDLLGQSGGRSMFVVVRTSGEPAQLAAAARSQARAIDREAPVYEMTTLAEMAARATAPRRFSLLLLGGFALVALLLAAIGVYGVLSYSVSRQTREIGVRLSLGAQAGDVLRLVLKQGMALVLAGVSLGLAGSLALMGLLRNLLFGVSANDPATFAAAALLLTAVAFLACYLPARRATKVDPMVALRY